MPSGNPKSGEKTVLALKLKDYAAIAPTGAELVAVDTKGFRFAKFVITSGVLTMSAGSIAFKVQESSDNFVSDAAADVTGATFAALTGGDDDEVHSVIVKCSETERYLKLFAAFGTVTVAGLSGNCVLSEPIDSVYVGTGGNDASVDAVAP